MKKILIVVVVIGARAFLYWTVSPVFISKTVQDRVPETSSMSVESAQVIDTPTHPASGTVRIVTNNDGTQTIHYENYNTLNGPDLFVYLAKDINADEFISLGRIKGTTGNISYAFPKDVDLSEYPYVLTWCRAFSTLFNYADLSTIVAAEMKNNPEVCIQVITPARNPETGEIREFPTPCAVPDGWEKIENEVPDLESGSELDLL